MDIYKILVYLYLCIKNIIYCLFMFTMFFIDLCGLGKYYPNLIIFSYSKNSFS